MALGQHTASGPTLTTYSSKHVEFGRWLPTFRLKILLPSLRYGRMLHQNVDIQLPHYRMPRQYELFAVSFSVRFLKYTRRV
jgi:hypothetical protein